MKREKMYAIVKYLALFGIVLAVYLLYQQAFRPAFQICSVNSYINCDAIISGEVAKTLGVPTPIYGLLGYIFILYAALKSNLKLLLSMASFGLLFCLWIAYKELFLLRVICPICILCQIDMISVFVLGLLIKREKFELT